MFSSDSTVVFNELLYNPAIGDTTAEWVELYNQRSVDVDISGWRLEGGIDYLFAEGTTLAAGDYLVVTADPVPTGGALGPFTGALANNGEEVRLVNHSNRTMDTIDYGDSGEWPAAADGSGASLAKINELGASGDPANWTSSIAFGGTPGAANFPASLPLSARPTILINEIAPSTDANFWLELVNVGDASVNLQNFVITVDGVGTLNDYVLPSQVLAPGAMAVVTESQLLFDAQDGDKVYLYGPAKAQVVDAQQVSAQLQGLSDSYDGWWFPDVATPGSANSFQFVDDIVINEIMYHHQPLNNGGGYFEDGEEWIELYNRGTQTIDLSGWRFGDGVGFTFAPGTTIAAGAYVVIADDPVALAARFPAIAGSIVGNYTGNLSNSGEQVMLLDAAGNPADLVRYYDGGYWHEQADGNGSSLELRDPDADNAAPSAWAPSDESGSSGWQTYSYTETATAPLYSSALNFQELRLGLLGDGVVLLDDVQVIQRPGIDNLDLMQNGDFESGATAWRFGGTHIGSQVIVDPDDAGNNVLRIEATGPRDYFLDVIESTLAGGASVVNGWEYTISYRAKWVSGSNQVHTELHHNRVVQTTLIDAPQNNGTPGAQNSQHEANIGPTYSGFIHGPVVPNAGQAVTVSSFIDDPDGIGSATLLYRVDGGTWTAVPMSLDSDGKYAADIPGQSAGTVVQFYVAATDALGAGSTFPALGQDSRALFIVQDNKASSSRQNIRLIMLASESSDLYAPESNTSNRRLGGTVIYNESEVHYDAGVRLRGSIFHRNVGSAGFNIQFQPDNLFRGVHESIGLKQTSQQVLFVNHLITAAGGVAGHYDDVVRFITPPGAASGQTGTFILQAARYTDTFLNSQYEDGGAGAMYSLQRIRDLTHTVDGPISSNPESQKITTQFGNGTVTDIEASTDTEQYRYQFEIRNGRGRDDFAKVVELGNLLQLDSASIQATANDVIDVDQVMRVLAMASLLQPWDFYTAGVGTKNLNFFAPVDGGPLQALPWDWDSAFSNNGPTGTNAPLFFTGSNLANVTAIPAFTRLLHGHLLDIINTTYNTTYAGPWASHLGSVAGIGLSNQLTYLGNRSAHVLSQLPAQIPFSITTNGGANFSTTDASTTLTGQGWIDVRQIRIAGQNAPLDVTWLDGDTWQVALPLAPGANSFSFEAIDHQGAVVGTDAVTVTRDSGAVSPRDVLRITELHYNPVGATPAEQAAGFTDGDQFEFIELLNTSTTDSIDLVGVSFADGINDVVFVGDTTTTTQLDFNTGVDGFVFQANTFNATSQAGVASATYDPTGGVSASPALRVDLASATDVSPNYGPSSGAFTRDFTLASPGDVTVSFDYRFLYEGGFEANEIGQAIAELGGLRLGSAANGSLVSLTGDGNNGPPTDTGWVSFTTTINLPAGTHALALGAYYSASTFFDEGVHAWFDNLEVSTADALPLAPGERALVVSDQAAFIERYGQSVVDGAAAVAQYTGRLSNGGERVELVDADGFTIHAFTYEDGDDPGEEAWATSADGDGPSLVVVDTEGDYDDGANWFASATTHGTPGADEVSAIPADMDGDGDVDDADFGIAFAAFTGPNNGPSSNPAADLDGDGDVDDADFGLFFAAFTGPLSQALAGSSSQTEPQQSSLHAEPASLASAPDLAIEPQALTSPEPLARSADTPARFDVIAAASLAQADTRARMQSMRPLSRSAEAGPALHGEASDQPGNADTLTRRAWRWTAGLWAGRDRPFDPPNPTVG